MQLLAPVSVGELIDKITILKIKRQKASDAQKLANVTRELEALCAGWEKNKPAGLDISELENQLSEVNKQLWDIEDKIRAKELANTFDQEFIDLARAVYKHNDLRARIKKQINLSSGSSLVEEKLYQEY